MLATGLIFFYCLLIATASFAGGLLPTWIKLTHTRLQTLMSFVGGMILGVALLHMLPHAIAGYDNVDVLVTAMLVGVLTMFFLMRVFHIHHHEPVPENDVPSTGDAKSDGHDDAGEGQAPASHDQEHHDQAHHDQAHPDQKHTDHKCQGHGHSHGHDHSHGKAESKHLHSHGKANWIGLAIGFAVHTVMDGVALAASVIVAAAHHDHFELYGFGIFLAIVLHKPLDAMSIAWTAKAGGWSKKWMTIANVAFAMMCPLGALAFFIGVDGESERGAAIVAIVLAFSAGVFLCISLSDILPEVSFHSHDRAVLSVALVLGVILAWSIGFLEPDHVHRYEGTDQSSPLDNGMIDIGTLGNQDERDP